MYAKVHLVNNYETETDSDSGSESTPSSRFDFSYEKIKPYKVISSDDILNSLQKAKYGDFVEDLSKSGNRMGHIYIINKNDAGKLYICPLDNIIDDYGCIGHNFSLGPDFSPGYWTFGYEQGCGNGYWHHDTAEEPVSKDILKNIKKDDLIESTQQSYRYISADYKEINVIEKICDIKFDWGTLRFTGSKDTVMNKLNIILTETNNSHIYFTPSRKINKLGEIADFDWIEPDNLRHFEDEYEELIEEKVVEEKVVEEKVVEEKVVEEVVVEEKKILKYDEYISKYENKFKCYICNKLYIKNGKSIRKHIEKHF